MDFIGDDQERIKIGKFPLIERFPRSFQKDMNLAATRHEASVVLGFQFPKQVEFKAAAAAALDSVNCLVNALLIARVRENDRVGGGVPEGMRLIQSLLS